MYVLTREDTCTYCEMRDIDICTSAYTHTYTHACIPTSLPPFSPPSLLPFYSSLSYSLPRSIPSFPSDYLSYPPTPLSIHLSNTDPPQFLLDCERGESSKRSERKKSREGKRERKRKGERKGRNNVSSIPLSCCCCRPRICLDF